MERLNPARQSHTSYRHLDVLLSPGAYPSGVSPATRLTV